MVFEGQIVCKNLEVTSKFGRAFLKLQTEHWGGYEAMARYHLFSNILKLALEKGVIKPDDFMVDDNHVVNKLKSSGDKEILRKLNFLRQKSLSRVTRGGVVIYKKFRYIDPLFVRRGALSRLSKVDKEFEKELENAREENLKGVLVPN